MNINMESEILVIENIQNNQHNTELLFYTSYLKK